MFLLYRNLVQTFHFGYSSFQFCLQAMLFLYRHLVQTFQFGYSSSLYTGFWYRLSFQFGYWLCCFYIDIWYRLSSSSIVLVCILAFVIGFPVWLQAMLVLYRHLVLTFQFGYSSSLYTGFCRRLSFQFGYRLCCFYIDIWQRLSNSAIVLVCIFPFGIDFRSSFAIGNVVFIQTFGTDFPVCLQFQFVYRLLVQTFQFGYRPCFYYIEIWYRLSISAIVLICILAFGIDFPVCPQAMLFLYRHLVQILQFGYSSSLYAGFWYRLSSLVIGYVAFIQKFGTDFLVRLQFQFVYYRLSYRLCWYYIDILLTFHFGYSSKFVYWLLEQTFFPVRLQAMLFLYRHLVQTFQFGYSSSLYTCFWYRLASLVIGNVAFIQTFGTDFPVWLQFQFVYRLLVQTFLFSYIVFIQTFGTDFPIRLQFQFVYAFGIDFPVWLQAMLLLYRHLLQTFQFGCSSSLYTGFWYRLSSLAIDYVFIIQKFGTDFPFRLQF